MICSYVCRYVYELIIKKNKRKIIWLLLIYNKLRLIKFFQKSISPIAAAIIASFDPPSSIGAYKGFSI